jgi:hypothetical protein
MPPKAHAHPPATVPAEPVVLSDNDRAKEVKKYYEQAPNDARIAHAILVKRFACNSQAAGRRAASREYAPRHVEQQAKRPFIVALRPVRFAPMETTRRCLAIYVRMCSFVSVRMDAERIRLAKLQEANKARRSSAAACKSPAHCRGEQVKVFSYQPTLPVDALADPARPVRHASSTTPACIHNRIRSGRCQGLVLCACVRGRVRSLSMRCVISCTSTGPCARTLRSRPVGAVRCICHCRSCASVRVCCAIVIGPRGEQADEKETRLFYFDLNWHADPIRLALHYASGCPPTCPRAHTTPSMRHIGRPVRGITTVRSLVAIALSPANDSTRPLTCPSHAASFALRPALCVAERREELRVAVEFEDCRIACER